jgi:hypothetical protein
MEKPSRYAEVIEQFGDRDVPMPTPEIDQPRPPIVELKAVLTLWRCLMVLFNYTPSHRRLVRISEASPEICPLLFAKPPWMKTRNRS